jgi:hypothetical protein
VSRFDEIKQDIADGFRPTESDAKYLIGEIERLTAQRDALLAVPDDIEADPMAQYRLTSPVLMMLAWVQARMAAVVEGENDG